MITAEEKKIILFNLTTRREFLSISGKGIAAAVLCTLLLGVSYIASAGEEATVDKNLMNAYKHRLSSLNTATIDITYIAKYFKPGKEPEDTPKSIIINGKIDRLKSRSKMRVIMSYHFPHYGEVKVAFEIDKPGPTSDSLQHNVMLKDGVWVRVKLKGESPAHVEDAEVVLLKSLFLPQDISLWNRRGNSEEAEVQISGVKQKKTFHVFQIMNKDRFEFAISTDGALVRHIKVFDSQGTLRMEGAATDFVKKKPVGIIPKQVLIKDYDSNGNLFRELRGNTTVEFNEQNFSY